MDITIRKVLPEEAHEYTICHINCWQSAYKDIVPGDYLSNMMNEIEQRTENLRKALSEPSDYEYYCVVTNDKIIGRLIIGKSHDEDKPDAGDLGAIYLLEDYWDKGYGRIMMNFALKRFGELGYNEIIIWSFEANDRANQFYKKFGFKPDGIKNEMNLGKPLTIIRHIINIWSQ